MTDDTLRKMDAEQYAKAKGAPADVLADLRNVASLYGIDISHSIGAVAELIAERDALRSKLDFLTRHAVKNDAYDIHGGCAAWSIGVYSDDSRLGFDQVLNAAIARVGGEK